MEIEGYEIVTNYDEQELLLVVAEEHWRATNLALRSCVSRIEFQCQLLGLRPQRMCLAKCRNNQALMFPYIERRVIWAERDERTGEVRLMVTAAWLFILLDWTERVAINSDPSGGWDGGPPVRAYAEDLINFFTYLEGIDVKTASNSLLLGADSVHGKGTSPGLGSDDFVTSWELES